HRRRVALINAREVVDLLGIELGQHLGDGEAIRSRVAQHSRRAEERIVDYGGAAAAAILAPRGPLGAPEAARLAPDRLATMDAQVARLPVNGLRAGADFADSPHTGRLVSKLAHTAPHEIFFVRAHRTEAFGNLVLGQSFLPQQDSEIEL